MAEGLARVLADLPSRARVLLENSAGSGETLGARDALEHALLLAPEFSQARRLMAQIISG